MLLSAVIQVFGNGSLISNGAGSGSAGNYTDFQVMPTTYTTALGSATRTFQIKNLGDANLNLTGGSALVAISGVNPSDFTVTIPPSTPISTGGVASFTIAFKPQAAGQRTAVVIIASSDPSAPSYTFTVQGTGLDVTTTAADGLQIATTTVGSGAGAINSSQIVMNYVEYSLDGRALDSAYAPGNATMSFTEGGTEPYFGWNEGLAGIKPGETRTVFVPASVGGGSVSTFFTFSAVSVSQPAHSIIQVFGNNTLITNGAASGLAGNFTDFQNMPTTYTTGFGSATRMFQIKNLGDSDMTLTGSPDLVAISGEDATDFTVTSQPGATISSGGVASFTIAFKPQAAGPRSAVVTIASSDPNAPSYTYTIQGTGLDVTTTTADGIQIATTVAGSGAGAIVGSDIVVNYVAYALDGTGSDTSHAPGSSTYDFVDGRLNTFGGWNAGLLGIQAGEERTIFVPAALTAGTSSAVFTVTAVSVSQPAIGVKGNGVAISNGTTTSATTNFTAFGVIPLTGSMDSDSRKFQLLNNGSGDLWLAGSSITITGAAAGDFTVTPLADGFNVPAGNTSSNFTITFSPQAAGVRHATVNIVTNDPSTPVFSFDIEGTGSDATDLGDGVQIATTTAGSGAGATQGTDVSVVFSGSLFDGTVFDSASNGSPAHMIVGSANLPAGLSEGLVGIKAGETRMIFMPAAQAWGTSSHNSIPANSSLIYKVTAISLGMPTVGLTVTGNEQTIAAGDNTPSSGDFTDFGSMSTTADATIGTVSRTYKITNTGGLPLLLTGASRIAISGANADDFIVTTSPAGSIASGVTSTFTISFVPQGTGVRSAVVTIVSNNATVPSFTFAIQGTGVATNNNSVPITTTNGTNSTTTNYPLQIATIVTGTGSGATNGTLLSMHYTGYLLNGKVFDSNTGTSPFQFTLGAGSVIKGWDNGLQGIKVGESRVLVIPAGLAYGSADYSGIPGNSTLIFKVTCLSESRPSMSVGASDNQYFPMITAGDTTPSTADYTDFRYMSTTADSSIGLCSRTYYLMNNVSSTTEYLSASAVTITGRNAGDFVVQTQPATVIQGGSYSSFTIAFAPQGTGLRKATVNVAVNDAARTTYSFSIQGTGLATTNNTTYHFQYATVAAGIAGDPGAVAANGTNSATIVMFDYTAFTASGSVYDSSTYQSSALRGHGPIEAYAGGIGNSLPLGLDLALVGMKQGETRQIILSPAAAATDSSYSESSTVFLEVTRLEEPVLEVGVITTSGTTSSYTGIAAGENSPAASDTTLLGTIAAGSTVTTLTSTFRLSAYSTTKNLNFTADGSYLHLTGGDARNFTSYATSDSVNGFRYVVTFTGSVPGSYNTTAHIYTNDPNHPDFSFAIGATVTPWVDLTGTVGTVSLPNSGTITAGDPTVYNIPITVTNGGNAAVTYTTSGVGFQVYLHKATAAATDNSSDVLLTLANYTTSALKGLGAGKSTTVKIPVSVPATVNSDAYVFVVKMNSSGAVSEFNATNNTVTSAQTLQVVRGDRDLVSGIGTIILPNGGTITSGAGNKITVPVQLTNQGSLPISATTSPVDVAIYLHNTAATDNSGDVLVSAANYTTSALRKTAAGKTVTVNVPVSVPLAVNTGDYEFVVKMNTQGQLPEVTGTNNGSTSTQTLHVVKGTRDLVSSVGAVSALTNGTITSGAGGIFKIPVTVTNQGNTVVTYTTSGVDFQVYLHNKADSYNYNDVLLVNDYISSALKGLGGNKSAKVTIPVSIPISVVTGEYELLVKMNTSGAVAESSDSNNTATSQTIHVVQGTRDLTSSVGVVPALTNGTITSGAGGVFKIPVTVTNQGNTIVTYDALGVDFKVYLHNNSDSDNVNDILLTNNYTTSALKGLGGNKSAKVTIPVSIPMTVPSGTYQLLVKMNSSGAVSEASATNNTGTLTQTIHVVQGTRDLVSSIGTVSAFSGGTLTSGADTSFVIPLTITNQGNMSFSATASPIDVAIYLRSTTAVDDSGDLLVSAANFTTSAARGLLALKSTALSMPVTIPITVGSGDYKLVVKMNTRGQLNESNTENNSSMSSQTISVVQGYRDLTSSIGTVSEFSAGTLTSGSTTSYTIPVQLITDGNLPIPGATNAIDVSIYVHNTAATDNSSDVLVSASGYTTTALRNAGSEQSTAISMPVTIPITVGTGDYNLVVRMNTQGRLNEVTTTNNSSTSAQTIHVVQGYWDLTSGIGTVSAFSAGTLTSGSTVSYSIPVLVVNQGNLPISGTTNGIDMGIYLHNMVATDNSSDVLVSAANYTTTDLRNVGSEQSATITVNVTIPLSVGAGDYNLLVKMNTQGQLSETTTTNNSSTSAQTIHVVQGYWDLTSSIGTVSTFDSGTLTSGATTSYTIPVLVANNGNLPISATTSGIDVSIYVHNTAATDNSSDILISAANYTTSDLRNVGSQQTATISVPVTIPLTVGAGDYNLLVKLNTQGKLAETTTTNNSSTSAQVIHVLQGNWDLTSGIGTVSAFTSGTLTSGATTSYTIPVQLINQGNLPISATTSGIDVGIYLHNTAATDNSSDVLVSAANYTTNALRNVEPQQSATVEMPVTIPLTVGAGDYKLVVKMNTLGHLTETTSTNNSSTSAQTIHVVQGYWDLTSGIGTVSAFTSGTLTSGATTSYSIPVLVVNQGNLPISGTTSSIDVGIYLHNTVATDNSSDVLVSAANYTTTALRNVGSGQSATISVPMTIPLTVGSGDYKLVVKMNTQGHLSENTATNNTSTSAQTIHVVQGVYGLHGQLTGSTFRKSLAATTSLSGVLKVTFSNTGNLALPANQTLVIQVVAINTTTNAHTNVGAPSTITLGALKSHGTSSAFSSTVTLTAGLPAGGYKLGFDVTPAPTLSGVTGFTVSAKANGAVIPLTIT